ncbi:unnamed protein product [Musa acuminata subsp. malaccensis]|uniref:(wild Malaysian banana) hypothetical protein n=1 Tax=Musa acuminata subsp. malaccensis TaxID=214687 RepID=A0A804IEX2_MUSAM|nr:PREDICTED: uncharacterized protein LOC103979224 [Musa acuminata subsp. malaccensis]XP_009393563.1 PREDICTED: uncharacterized protein LOC103979224 [Musa acuminata subsp. malaccensis]XP_009393566.1 PREDICTED: uncharacterized protein LOC103979224 [Musa acuminata subsp. malaccensis]XP_018678371.1 PREDICTED: uncharacterized protein LOC103979224 [Musa acuminata subsp. malaccensis]XP_018678372.1 PREDICTED: uncharacterized protein LOC103979224 [Musa acuminata subsp. malaccensis]CAG1850928.1 unnamed
MMSVAVMQSSSAAVFDSDKCSRAAPVDRYRRQDDPPLAVEESHAQERPGQFDIWSAIQSQEAAAAAADQPAAPYVHPLARRSSSLLSQKSLEICTERLGSETGSDGFSSFMDDLDFHHPSKLAGEETEEEKKYVPFEKQAAGGGARELASVSSHCSVGRRSPPRSFPPPLPSISQRNVPCLHMRPHRLDGRLVMEAVAVPSKNYFHAQRVDGRLVLSLTDTTSGDKPGHASDATEITQPQMPEDVEQDNEDTVGNDTTEITQLEEEEEEEEEELEETNRYEEEEEEEEVEVVDRGTIVEVKVSTQPQQQNGAMKVHRSSLVINKFVGGAPLTSMTKCEQPVPSTVVPRRASPTTTTAAAAASTLSVTTEGYNDYGYIGLWAPLGGHHPPLDNKLLFTSKRRNRGELLHIMRRCSQLRRPLFIREPWCAVTST